MNWIVAIIIIALLIWMIYTASQTAKVKSDNGSMSGMPGMNASGTEKVPTQMPPNMPGMNHP